MWSKFIVGAHVCPSRGAQASRQTVNVLFIHRVGGDSGNLQQELPGIGEERSPMFYRRK